MKKATKVRLELAGGYTLLTLAIVAMSVLTLGVFPVLFLFWYLLLGRKKRKHITDWPSPRVDESTEDFANRLDAWRCRHV